MAKRIDKTVADLVVAALMPALLVGLLTSLVFFLLELAYSGQYIGQMKNVLFFFVIGAVLIARITMMGDIADRATVYGILLAIAAGLALVRFVEVPKTSLAGFAWLIPVALMAVVWWSAHKLTLDCTWDEETDQAETGGLLDHIPRASGSTASPDASARLSGSKVGQSSGTSEQKGDWLDRYQSDRQAEQKRKKPGTAVIYFSLAALPLFGLGQAILPSSDLDRRRYAFWLLALYLACGLGLLLTTSFLGLRRYLRARRLQMPAAMTGLWLSLGGIVILALLFLGSIIPRPEAEYSLTQLLGWAGSNERDANKFHFFEGSSGKSDESGKGPRNRNEPQPQDPNGKQTNDGKQSNQQTGRQGGNQTGNTGKQQQGEQNQSGQGQGKNQGQGKSGESNNQSQSKSSQGNRQGNNQSGKQQGEQKGDQGEQNDQAKEGERGNEENQRGANGKKDQRKEQGRLMQGNKKKQEQEKEKQNEGVFGQQDKPQQQQNQPQQQRDSSPPPETPRSTSWDWLKWLVYAALILGAIYALYRWGKELWLGLLQIWQDILAWWRGLWAGSKPNVALSEAVPEIDDNIPLRPFSWFSNPLLEPNRFRSMEEMIRYSFAALHSWAAEQNFGREKGETSTEFAVRIGAMTDACANEIRKLADLYALVTYAGRKAPASSETILRNFWNRIPAPMGQLAVTA
jgi:hypothetical protein